MKKPGLLQGLLVFLFISICFYFLCRTIFIIFAPYGALEKTLATLFLLAETFVMFQAFGYFTNIYRINRQKAVALNLAALKDFPSVAILSPARHEPKALLENTLACLYNLDYPNKHIYLLDDSSQESFKNEAEE
jgi:cellulose synthase (UDP-forming)